MSDILCPRLKAPFSWEFPLELPRLELPQAVSMHQVAREQEGAPFRSTRLVLAHDGAFLYVVAEMEDRDIFNRATHLNERTWMTGDVFEIFLRPESQEAYYEFHVTPENCNLQIRIENSAFFYFKTDPETKKARFRQCLLEGKIIESRSEILRKEERWRIMASIPIARVCENKAWDDSDVWLVSFCRYDYTRGKEKPVLSSTSFHDRPDFHNQSAWRRLLFKSDDSLS